LDTFHSKLPESEVQEPALFKALESTGLKDIMRSRLVSPRHGSQLRRSHHTYRHVYKDAALTPEKRAIKGEAREFL
jgi:hypothetical protein